MDDYELNSNFSKIIEILKFLKLYNTKIEQTLIGISEYSKFCDAISNLIQGKSFNSEFLVIYGTLSVLDLSDKKKIDNTIGADINACLFSI